MSDNELDSLMMQADIANQEAKPRRTRPALDPNAANPREPFVAVPIKEGGGMKSTSYRMNENGDWVEMTPEEVQASFDKGDREREEKAEKKGHYCDENPQEYGFEDEESGRWYHGQECSICGELIHTG